MSLFIFFYNYATIVMIIIKGRVMRVVSGSARGTKLDSIDSLSTRPTQDRVKESLFNIIFDEVYDSNFLDLFAGSGAVGIEALSRGAEKVIFVENDFKALQVLKKNILLAKYEEASNIYSIDVLRYLRDVQNKFDIIFLDPPYMDNYYNKVLDLIIERDILVQNGLVIVESKKNTLFLQESSLFLMEKEKTYGKTTVTYLRKK